MIGSLQDLLSLGSNAIFAIVQATLGALLVCVGLELVYEGKRFRDLFYGRPDAIEGTWLLLAGLAVMGIGAFCFSLPWWAN